MKKFWIDFNGYLCVEAEDDGDAEKKFWELIHNRMDLTTPYSDDVWDIDCIEEREEPAPLLRPVYGVATAQELEDFWNDK